MTGRSTHTETQQQTNTRLIRQNTLNLKRLESKLRTIEASLPGSEPEPEPEPCLLYTSDAADE